LDAVVSRVYGADLGCDKQRQYRFEVFTAESRYCQLARLDETSILEEIAFRRSAHDI
jgi:hypothetical protein